MATMTKAPKVKGHGPGKYKILRGVHYDGQKTCSCGARLYKDEREQHLADNPGHIIAEGQEFLVIYGAKDDVTGGFKGGSNAGHIIDSRHDLSKLNTGPDKKFIWIGVGKYTPKSHEPSFLDKMSLEELMQEAADREIPLDPEIEWTRDDVLAEIRTHQTRG